MGLSWSGGSTTVRTPRPRLPRSIEAGAVVLRQCRSGDLQDLLLALTASADELRPWVGWLHGVPTAEQSQFFLRQAEASFEDGNSFSFNLWERETGQLVGQCGLELRTANVGELGCWIRADRHGRGYAVSAGRAVIAAALEHLPDLARFQMYVDPGNIAGAVLPRNLGFVPPGGSVDQADEEPVHTWTLARPG